MSRDTVNDTLQYQHQLSRQTYDAFVDTGENSVDLQSGHFLSPYKALLCRRILTVVVMLGVLSAGIIIRLTTHIAADLQDEPKLFNVTTTE